MKHVLSKVKHGRNWIIEYWDDKKDCVYQREIKKADIFGQKVIA